jgi:hypothetical protein
MERTFEEIVNTTELKDGVEVPNTKIVGPKGKKDFETVIDELLKSVETN